MKVKATDPTLQAVGGITELVDRLRVQFRAVTGLNAVTVASLRHSEDVWSGRIEAVEVHRTPDTQDLVGVYDVELDHAGNLLAWDRLSLRIKGHPGGMDDATV